jgi:hypothetical protein
MSNLDRRCASIRRLRIRGIWDLIPRGTLSTIQKEDKLWVGRNRRNAWNLGIWAYSFPFIRICSARTKGRKGFRPNIETRLDLYAQFWRIPYSPLNAGARSRSAQSGIELGRPISDGICFPSIFSFSFLIFTCFSFGSAGFLPPVFCFADWFFLNFQILNFFEFERFLSLNIFRFEHF